MALDFLDFDRIDSPEVDRFPNQLPDISIGLCAPWFLKWLHFFETLLSDFVGPFSGDFDHFLHFLFDLSFVSLKAMEDVPTR